MDDVVVIVVAYNTSISSLEKIKKYSSDFRVLVSDNSEEQADRIKICQWCSENGINYITESKNVGIAKAINNAVIASGDAVKYYLLLDDDSLFNKELIDKLFSHAELLINIKKEKIAAVCAMAFDENGSCLSKIQKDNSCRDLMSSGALITAESLRSVGFMNDGLFIDCVDFEWGWRAQSKGYKLVYCPDTNFMHSLGIKGVNNSLVTIRKSSPIRQYYQYRNVISMFFVPYAPIAWKIKQLLILPIKFVLYPFIMGDGLSRWNFMAKGIVDGINRKHGKYDDR